MYVDIFGAVHELFAEEFAKLTGKTNLNYSEGPNKGRSFADATNALRVRVS